MKTVRGTLPIPLIPVSTSCCQSVTSPSPSLWPSIRMPALRFLFTEAIPKSEEWEKREVNLEELVMLHFRRTNSLSLYWHYSSAVNTFNGD